MILIFPIALFSQTTFVSKQKNKKIDKAFYGLNGNVYYVAESGDDTNNGRSDNLPFKTLQRASDLTEPGDIVYVMNGLYKNEKDEDLLGIRHSGTESNWIMYAALRGHKPKLKVKAGDAISVYGADYLIIQGFEVEGNNPDVTIDYALAEKDSLQNKLTNSSGVSIHPEWNTTNFSHHLIIRNCHAHHFSGSGIASHTADYVLIEKNTVHHNGYYCPWAMSGISVYKNWNFDNYHGYKIIIRNNISYANRNYVPFYHSSKISAERKITDGNGIIIDTTRESVKLADSKKTLIPYIGRTLVENNIVFLNGGRGIHIYKSNNVDAIHNTTYHNSMTKNTFGDVSLGETDDINLINNIIYPKANDYGVYVYNAGSSVNIDYNLIYSTKEHSFSQANNIFGLDPLLMNLDSKIDRYNFQLKPDSPAINNGSNRFGSKVDYMGNVRPVNKKVDIGAFEFGGKNPTDKNGK